MHILFSGRGCNSRHLHDYENEPRKGPFSFMEARECLRTLGVGIARRSDISAAAEIASQGREILRAAARKIFLTISRYLHIQSMSRTYLRGPVPCKDF
jgi:hypothetical protein